MKTIPYDQLASAVEKLVIETNYVLPDDVLQSLRRARAVEPIPLAASILDRIIENAQIAADERLPLCQDTGVAVFFIDVGDAVFVDGGGLTEAIQEGTRHGYRNGGLRMSLVGDPIRRQNTGDNTPAIIHCRPVPGERLRVSFCPKGAGCENMSRLAMLPPGAGVEGISDFVVETVRRGDGKTCPPVLAGVGIGGDFEYAALLAKRALLRPVGDRHPDALYAGIERELVERLNGLGIGPMGLGGSTTALDVFIETHPCHIASLPVAVNIQCHSARHGTIEL
ncbi:fumarate hydratase [Candidatus Latescibacterota bacterium]